VKIEIDIRVTALFREMSPLSHLWSCTRLLLYYYKKQIPIPTEDLVLASRSSPKMSILNEAFEELQSVTGSFRTGLEDHIVNTIGQAELYNETRWMNIPTGKR
jgi:hypothetical protein